MGSWPFMPPLELCVTQRVESELVTSPGCGSIPQDCSSPTCDSLATSTRIESHPGGPHRSALSPWPLVELKESLHERGRVEVRIQPSQALSRCGALWCGIL